MCVLLVQTVALLLLCITGVTSLGQPTQQGPKSTPTTGSSNRRGMLLTSFGSIAISSATAVSIVPAVEAADVTTRDGSIFCGTYSDPVNHPGGTRTIRLVGEKVGDYQLAEVTGGGGIGEPKHFLLPAIVIGDRAIIIDFSPKGGPRDFTGVIDKDGGIRFPRDGNKWPRLSELVGSATTSTFAKL
jgi:hypothetical protein